MIMYKEWNEISYAHVQKIVHLFTDLVQSLKMDELSYRDPNFVNQILLCSLGSVVFYKNIICTVSDVFIGDLNVFLLMLFVCLQFCKLDILS